MLPLELVLVAATSSPTTVAAGSCATPDVPAAVAAMPLEPPAMLLATDEHGTAELHVWLSDKTGKPDKVELVQPSGSEIVDGAAMETTQQTKFQPETRSCATIAGEYFYEFEY